MTTVRFTEVETSIQRRIRAETLVASSVQPDGAGTTDECPDVKIHKRLKSCNYTSTGGGGYLRNRCCCAFSTFKLNLDHNDNQSYFIFDITVAALGCLFHVQKKTKS